MMRTFSVVFALLAASAPSLSQTAEPSSGEDTDGSSLKITSGTMELGGTADFRSELSIPDSGDSRTGLVLNLSPMAGYFLADGFEVAARLGLGFFLGDRYSDVADTVSFALGARYFIETKLSLVLYFGLAFGMNFLIASDSDIEVQKSLAIEAPIGLLIPLNRHVAIDLGLMLSFVASLEEMGGSTLSVPIGYMGIQAFF
jgi:hypothetical protein